VLFFVFCVFCLIVSQLACVLCVGLFVYLIIMTSQQVNSYKEKEKELQGGMFADESHHISDDCRKRKSDEISHDTPKDIWSEFETIMMRGGGNRGDVYTQSAGKVDVNNVK
jgi:hypothetical protein